MIAALAAANSPFLGTATSISNKVLAVFVAFANITLEREANMYEFIPSGFICC